MSDLEQSVFSVIKRHPFCSEVLVAYKLGISQTEVRSAIDRLMKRGVLQS